MPDKWSQYKEGGQTADTSDKWQQYKDAGSVPAETPPAAPVSLWDKAKGYFSSFVNEPLIPYFANKAQEAAKVEQQQMNQTYGPESEAWRKNTPTAIQPLVTVARHLATLPTSGARVVYGTLGMSPMDASVIAASTATGQPEAAGAYFATKGLIEAPDQIKQAIQKPSPENVESALGTGATIAGGLAGVRPGSPPSVETVASETAKGNKAYDQARKAGTAKKIARTVTGVAPALEDAVARGAEKQEGYDIAAANKNVTKQKDFAQESDQTALENRAAEQALDLRRQTEADLTAKTDAYFNKETAAEQAADKANTQNWDNWRAKVSDVAEDPTPLLKTINDVGARFPEAKQVIQESMRSPEEMSAAQQQYVADRTAVMKQQGYGADYDKLNPEAKQNIDSLMKRLGINPPEGVAVDPTKPIPLQTIHELKSDIGWKLFRGEYPPTVEGAMKQVYGVLQAAESRGSLSAGALAELETARASHAQYQEAFGRSKPNRSYEGDVRMKEANPEAFDAQREEQRLAAVGKYDPNIPQMYRDVVSTREKLKGMQTEDQLRKGLKQPPKAPPTVEPKQAQVDIQKRSVAALRERAKNWGHYNARDIGILSSSVVLAPLMYFIGEAAYGHAGGASALAPIAAIGYESGKMAAASLLKSERFRNWVTKTPPEEINALARIPGADKVKIQDGLTQVVIDEFKRGNKVNIDPNLQSFLGPKNMQKIATASGAGISRTPADLKKKAQELTQ